MKVKRYIKYFLSVLPLLLLCMVMTGCSGSGLSDEEQYIYDLAAEHGSGSSTVELNTVIAYTINKGVDEDFDDNIEMDSAWGTQIYMLGVVLWDNGAKDDLFYEYYLDENGKLKGHDLYDTSSMMSGIVSNLIDYDVTCYKLLVSKGYKITLDEFKKGEMGYLDISDESLKKINEKLKKKK